MQRLLRMCWMAALLWGAMGLSVPVAAPVPVAAQPVDRTITRTAGETTRLFATLDLPDATDGLLVKLPRGWTFADAVVLRYGSEERATSVVADGAEIRISADAPLRGPHDISVRVRTADRSGSVEWSIQPYRRLDDGRREPLDAAVRERIRVVEARADGPRSTNRVLAFRDDASEPVILKAQQIPAFERSVSFTTEFWLSTTGLGEVVLSTWTGEEDRHYPMEMVVDAAGRLRYYCGQPGRHTSMTSDRPLADGRWHHVAVAYDGTTRFLRLMVDGVAVDSVEQVSLPGGYLRPDLAIGGRLPGAPESRGGGVRFSGRLDVLRIWSSARGPGEVRRTMRDAVVREAARSRSRIREARGAQQPDVVTFTFDRPPPSQHIRSWPSGAERRRMPLQLRQSVHELNVATEEETVRLQWHADATAVSAFLVERSVDGTSFEPVQRLTPEDAEPVRQGSDVQFTAVDEPPSRVAYYRIREVYPDGTTDVSGTFKVGIGTEPDTEEERTRILGNYPNPASTSTTVEFYLAEPSPVRVTLWDVSGKRLGSVYEQSHGAGTHTFSLAADDLPSGTYFLRLHAADTADAHTFVVLK